MDRIWLKSYPRYVDPAPVIPNISVADQFRATCTKFAENEAYWSMGVSLNYRQLQAHALQVTSWLQQSGFKKGDRVAIMLPNLLSFPVCLFGALLGGYVCTNINPRYTARELAYQLNDSGASVLFALESVLPLVGQSLAQLKLKSVVAVSPDALLGGGARNAAAASKLPGAIDFDLVLASGARRHEQEVKVDPGDVAFLQYTGGTTGVAKGATILHRNVIANMTQVNAWRPSADVDPRWAKMRAMQPMPLYHAGALHSTVMGCLPRGSACVLVPDARNIDSYIDVLRTERFTVMSGLNTLYNTLLNHPRLADVDFSSCVLTTAGSMPTQKSIAEKWKKATKLPLVEVYGMSEATCYITYTPIDTPEFTGSAGLPLPLTDVVIRNDSDADLAPDEIGEICTRGPQIMAGYWNRPDETSKVMTADGFLRTGDIGWMDERGFVHISDRKKDMILVSGFNVFPNEIEGVLAAHPKILESAVIGRPDPHSGEVPVAYVVPRDASLSVEEVLAFCRENLTGYKRPKAVVFLEALPKSAVGKLLRRKLRDPSATDS